MGKQAKCRKALTLFMIVLFSFAFIFLGFQLFNLRFNFTDSMPIGLYQLQKGDSLQRGQIIMVCLPEGLAQEGYTRGYLSKSITCPNHIEPVLKKLIAVPPDNVVLTNTQIIVNDTPLNAPLFRMDRKGRPTNPIPRGEYFKTKLYWIYGEHDQTYSWDSRYYGGVPRANIIGTAKPLFIF